MSKFNDLRNYLKTRHLNDRSRIDLSGLKPWDLTDEQQQLPMISNQLEKKWKFEKEKLAELILYHLTEQNLQLRPDLWREIFSFFDDGAKDFFDDKNRYKTAGQITLEMMFALSKASADQLYDIAPNRRAVLNPGERESLRNEIFENKMRELFVNITDEWFTFDVDLDQDRHTRGNFSTTELKEFLKSNAVVHAVVTTINERMKLTELSRINDKMVRTCVDEMRIYTCDYLAGLYGIALRDGIWLCLDRSRIPKGSILRKASIFCAAVNVFGHYVIRVNLNNYDAGSPSSNLPSSLDAGKLTNPSFMNVSLEIGHAVECSLCKYPVKWEYVLENVYGEQFFKRALNPINKSPLFDSEEEFLKSGLVKDDEAPLAFAGKISLHMR